MPIGLFSLPEFLCDLAVKFVGVGSFTSLPFGDGQGTTGMDTDANHYAMLDHDTETDTDYAQFRQYSNTQGRWLSPDPYHGSYNWRNPQSFNRYAYVGNDPLASVDPSGQMECNNDSCVGRDSGMQTLFGDPVMYFTDLSGGPNSAVRYDETGGNSSNDGTGSSGNFTVVMDANGNPMVMDTDPDVIAELAMLVQDSVNIANIEQANDDYNRCVANNGAVQDNLNQLNSFVNSGDYQSDTTNAENSLEVKINCFDLYPQAQFSPNYNGPFSQRSPMDDPLQILVKIFY